MRLEGEAMLYGGHLGAALALSAKAMVGYLKAQGELGAIFAISRAHQARRNYIETGSATRWGNCPITNWQPIEGKSFMWPIRSEESEPPAAT